MATTWWRLREVQVLWLSVGRGALGGHTHRAVAEVQGLIADQLGDPRGLVLARTVMTASRGTPVLNVAGSD